MSDYLVEKARKYTKIFKTEVGAGKLLTKNSVMFDRGFKKAPVVISFIDDGSVVAKCGRSQVTWPVTLEVWEAHVQREARSIGNRMDKKAEQYKEKRERDYAQKIRFFRL